MNSAGRHVLLLPLCLVFTAVLASTERPSTRNPLPIDSSEDRSANPATFTAAVESEIFQLRDGITLAQWKANQPRQAEGGEGQVDQLGLRCVTVEKAALSRNHHTRAVSFLSSAGAHSRCSPQVERTRTDRPDLYARGDRGSSDCSVSGRRTRNGRGRAGKVRLEVWTQCECKQATVARKMGKTMAIQGHGDCFWL